MLVPGGAVAGCGVLAGARGGRRGRGTPRRGVAAPIPVGRDSEWDDAMDYTAHNSLVKAALDVLEADQNLLAHIVLVEEDGITAYSLQEGKWISGRYDRNIRVDLPTHFQGLQGQKHASVYGRNRRNELVVVNLDGTASHGKKGRLSLDDAEALKAQGFKIRDDRMVEWTVVQNAPQLLLG
jgi:hypothetical protein